MEKKSRKDRSNRLNDPESASAGLSHLIEGFDAWIESRGGQGGHVKNSADIRSAADPKTGGLVLWIPPKRVVLLRCPSSSPTVGDAEGSK